MKVELTVNGGLLGGKLIMSNTQRHEWETAKDPSRRVRAWVRRYVAEMGYSAPSEDTAIDTACNAADGVITITALPVTGNGNGKPQGAARQRQARLAASLAARPQGTRKACLAVILRRAAKWQGYGNSRPNMPPQRRR